jgi:hypothetical protein
VSEAIFRSHIERYSCHVELATRLQSFEQKSDHVVAQLVRTTDDGREVPETVSVSFLLGTDGARGTLGVQLPIQIDAELFATGVVRKMLGLTFVGQTREAELIVTGDIHLTGLDRQVISFFSITHSWTDYINIVLALLG